MIDFTNVDFGPFLKAYHEEAIVKATVGEVSGRGHRVFLFGIPAYLPASQEVFGRPVDTGDEVDVRIIKIMPETNNVIVSAREAQRLIAQADAKELHVGDIIPVKVKTIVHLGTFVSIEGHPDGLIYRKELSYNYLQSADEVVAVGDEFDAKLVNINEKEGKTLIELSRRQALHNPWESLPFKVGDIVEGMVAAISDSGAILNIGPVMGTLHRSELSWTNKNASLREMLSIGKRIKVKILTIDKKNMKIAVSLRRAETDPWNELQPKVGDVLEGQILNKTTLGLFIGLKGGIEGLLHKDNISWLNDDQKSLLESLKVGDTIQTLIIGIDHAKRKLELSMKHLQPHPYDTFVAEHPSGDTIEATVVRNNVPGTMHISLPIGKFQIFFDPTLRNSWNEIMERYPVSGSISVRTKSYDPESKKIEFAPAI